MPLFGVELAFTMELIVGFAVSLFGGLIGVATFIWLMQSYYGFEKITDKVRVPGWLTGFIERLFFTILVMFDIPGTAVTMFLWLAVKMATNWNWSNISYNAIPRSRAFMGLLSGFISMLFALGGGLICRLYFKVSLNLSI